MICLNWKAYVTKYSDNGLFKQKEWLMNQINPKKLLNSKWTAVNPKNKEKHFTVTTVEFDEELVTSCSIEAVMSKREAIIQWQELKDTSQWLQGWK